MAVNREPILKRCKSLGISPAVMGIAKETKRDPNANKRKKVSEYGMQLKEKQKLKFIYGVLEKQFRHLFELAEKMEVRLVLTSLLFSSQDLTMLYTEWVFQ